MAVKSRRGQAWRLGTGGQAQVFGSLIEVLNSSVTNGNHTDEVLSVSNMCLGLEAHRFGEEHWGSPVPNCTHVSGFQKESSLHKHEVG
jgi:hypothetical protein